jgi:large subunit ribosomal protein L25
MSSRKRPTLKAENRQRLGTRYSTRIRREGKLPAVMYGHGKDPAHITLDQEQFVHHLHEGAHLLDVEGAGGVETCLIRDVQYDYLGNQIIHADLARVDLNELITVSVPLIVKGRDESPGAKAPGAVVEQPRVDLEIRCKAGEIPDSIVVDMSKLEMDHSITVAQLALPAGVKAVDSPDTIVLAIHMAKEEVVVATPAEGATTEPEVITAKKEEPAAGGEAAPAEKGKKKE